MLILGRVFIINTKERTHAHTKGKHKRRHNSKRTNSTDSELQISPSDHKPHQDATFQPVQKHIYKKTDVKNITVGYRRTGSQNSSQHFFSQDK